MDLVDFVGTVILITASGALAPGPLFFATISHGSRFGAKSGFLFSISHTIVEAAIVLLLALGLLSVANEPVVRLVVGVAGGGMLLFFGSKQVYDSVSSSFEERFAKPMNRRNLVFLGISLTGLNPFFLVWWLTAGAQLILLALEFGSMLGVLLMYVFHVWMDFVWLTSVAYFSEKGRSVIGLRPYRILLMVFGAFLIYFGFSFIVGSVGL
ncbi:MAG: LysE family transporter [Candidatus Bathyarchaeota archaeon]|nr:MAG: LysE family transporter [Candidatus Bathyarchaeota archaeon]